MGIQRKIDYLNSLDAYRRTLYSEALRYQHKVLGTLDEAEIVGGGTKVSANYASIESEIVVAWKQNILEKKIKQCTEEMPQSL